MKAVIFDLFETLITEWGKPKYLTQDVAADLNVDYQTFHQEWRALGDGRYLGKYVKVETAYKKILDNLGLHRDDQLLVKMAQKRTENKSKSFDKIEPKIMDMLATLKAQGYKIGLISNCSAEEIEGLQNCALYPYFDAVVLSCDVGMKKPDVNIYQHCLSLLGHKALQCYFVGDGGSDELNGAKKAGMVPLRALWFTKHFVKGFDADKSYSAFYEPEELVAYITPELTIRKATINDWEGIQAVHMGTPGPWANATECAPWVQKRIARGYYVQVAELNGQIVGHAEWVENHGVEGKFFYLCVMQIKDGYQGQGIGSKMVTDGIQKAKALGCEKVVTIPEEDTGSEKFYAKCGFTNGRQIKSISIPAGTYEYSQNYQEVDKAPFEIIKQCQFIFGLSQASPRHMWEVTNEKPTGDNRVTTTFISDAGDYIQLCPLYTNPHQAWALCWSNHPQPTLVKDILALAKSKGYQEIFFDFFAEYESYFNDFAREIIPYAVEIYKPTGVKKA